MRRTGSRGWGQLGGAIGSGNSGNWVGPRLLLGQLGRTEIIVETKSDRVKTGVSDVPCSSNPRERLA